MRTVDLTHNPDIEVIGANNSLLETLYITRVNKLSRVIVNDSRLTSESLDNLIHAVVYNGVYGGAFNWGSTAGRPSAISIQSLRALKQYRGWTIISEA